MSARQDKDPDRSGRGWMMPVAALTRFRRPDPGHSLPTQHVQAPRAESRWALPIAGYWLLVRGEQGCELVEWTTPCRLPGTPPWLLGVINVRGSLVPVFDVRSFMPEPVTEVRRPQRRLFVTGEGEDAVAVLIDGLPRRRQLDGDLPASAAPALSPPLAEWVSQAYGRGEERLLDCDLPRFLKQLGAQAAAL